MSDDQAEGESCKPSQLKESGRFPRTALKAGGLTAGLEDCLLVGRSTGETPDGCPTPAWQEKSPLSWRSLYRRGQG